MNFATRPLRIHGIALLLVGAWSNCCILPAYAGFAIPPDGKTTIVDMPTLFLGRADYVAGGAAGAFAGGVANWSPVAQEVNLGANFKIDVTDRHMTGPHGEQVPGIVNMLSINPAVPGGAQSGPFIRMVPHNGHTDWMQILMKPVAANRSRLYVRLDHSENGEPTTIDPAQFDFEVPEPAAGLLAVLAAVFTWGIRPRACRSLRESP